ncbi:hypothetical protein GF406_09770 [candidate division KSB1 bacterium]|nr:hypothetical protein [candidate division KSB1 bacterium]
MKINICFMCLVLCMMWSTLFAQELENVQHVMVAHEKGKFHGWPANNGAWHWGNEILVGFTQADYQIKDGHNLTGIQHSLFARSKDGGESWTVFDPENFLDDENIKWIPKNKTRLKQPLNFFDKGFALRIFATGYHGNDDPQAGFYYSYDRGATWNGPHFLGDIHNHAEFQDRILTPRTDYIVQSDKECFVFITSHIESKSDSRVACIHTKDGGLNFEFVTWITPVSDQYRAVMPNTVQLSTESFLLTFRKIFNDKSRLESKIEAFISNDRCQSWSFASTIKEIKTNSNPPATVKLDDGRVCCIYGDRDQFSVRGKYSPDDGKSWGKEFIIREGYISHDDWGDLGYPRLIQRPDGKLVALYYWASPEHPEHHIAASIWQP